MREEDVRYLSEFLSEFQSETDRGAALVGAALIDDRLERLLRSHFLDCKESSELLDGANAPLGTFSARIKTAYCLGLITELECRECDIIRRVRNEFAHRLHGLTFEDQEVHDLCNDLQANTPDGERFRGDARQLFINSVILTSLALWYRPEYNEPYRAKTREWDYQLSP
jgi:mannitol operon repressor